MLIKRNGFLAILIFILFISLLANIYSFNKLGKENIDNENKNEVIQNENNEDKEDIFLENENNHTENNLDKTDVNEEDDSKTNKLKDENNRIKKFIEYTVNTNEDDYTTRKKLAKEYMTEELYDKYFSADSIDTEEMNLLVEVKEVEIFLGYESNEAIVRYVVKETKAQGDYENEIEKYANIQLKDGKVSNIKSLSNNEWGI